MTSQHFGLMVSRLAGMTYIQTADTSADYPLRCAACHEPCRAARRRGGDRAWLCYRCADAKACGLYFGPRIFDTQPARCLTVGERLRGPAGMWTVAGCTRTPVVERGRPDIRLKYALEGDDGHTLEIWARDMADFHLIPPSQQQPLPQAPGIST